MKKFITMIIAAASMMTAVSCNRTFDEKEVPSDGTIYVTRTYEAGLDEATKTTIDAAGKVTWEQGDVIRYYSQKNGEVKTYTIDAPSAKVELALDVASTASFLIGVYGGTALTDNLGSSVNIQGAIPAEQTGVFGDHHVAITKTYDVTQQSLTFHNIVSYYKFTFIIDDVKSVVFKSNDGTQLHSYGNVNVSFDGDDATASLDGVGDSKITVNNGGRGTFYIAALPGTLQNGFTIDCYNSAHSLLGSVKTTKAVELKPNSILNLGVLDTRITQEYVDLSATGTANSYIVSETGFYKFKAIKGNSSESAGSVASAEVLWESFGTDVAPVEGELIDNVYVDGDYIKFRASALKGNAVIAAKNSSGTILWSWHIWMTDQPGHQAYKNNAGTLMDRNLGATSTTPGDVHSLGLHYQWGRKDPFLSKSVIDQTTIASSSVPFPDAINNATITGSNSKAYAIEHPMTYIYSTSSNPDWHGINDSVKDDKLWGGTKTIYDPCPNGYRVPDGGPTGIFATAIGSSEVIRNVPWNESLYIMDFGSYFGSGIWLPCAGCYMAPSHTLVAKLSGHYWTATTNGAVAYRLYFDSEGTIGQSTTIPRERGNSVRCFLEGSGAPVSSISLNKTYAALAKGATLQLSATISPVNAPNKSITWTSSNSSIASVSATGLVTAKSAGKCVITVTATNGVKATCTIVVSDSTFWTYILSTYDTDKDGTMNATEISKVTNLDIGTKGFTELTNIGKLTALKYLNIATLPVTSFDVSTCTSLVWIYANNCTKLSRITLGSIRSWPSVYINRTTELVHGGATATLTCSSPYIVISTGTASAIAMNLTTSTGGISVSGVPNKNQAVYMQNKYNTYKDMLSKAGKSALANTSFWTNTVESTDFDPDLGTMRSYYTFKLSGELKSSIYVGQTDKNDPLLLIKILQ